MNKISFCLLGLVLNKVFYRELTSFIGLILMLADQARSIMNLAAYSKFSYPLELLSNLAHELSKFYAM